MTVDTQKLRELLEKATPGPWKHVVEDNIIYADAAPRLRLLDLIVRSIDTSSEQRDADAAYIAAANPDAVSALLDEIDRLRAELQARQWMPIESCPRQHGKHYLICKDCGPGTLPSISIGYCFEDKADWHLVESNCTAEQYGYRVTHWRPLPLPPAPPQGETA